MLKRAYDVGLQPIWRRRWELEQREEPEESVGELPSPD